MPITVLLGTEISLWHKVLLTQDYVASRLKPPLQTFYDRHHELVDLNKISISQMAMAIFALYIFFSFRHPRQDFVLLAYE